MTPYVVDSLMWACLGFVTGCALGAHWRIGR